MCRVVVGFGLAWILVTAGTLARAGEEPVKFAAGPKVTSEKDGVKIEFAVSRNTDAAVEIMDKDGEIVRHLAAGVLGPNAPAPFKKNSLTQSLVWDRKDDAGKPAAGGPFSVKVGLGLRAKFDRIIGWSGRTVGRIRALAVDDEGRLYCLNGRGPSLHVFDRNGKYLRALLPHSPDQSAKKLAGIKTIKRADGVRVPFLRNMNNPYTWCGMGAWGSMTVTAAGKILIAGPWKGSDAHRVAVIGCDGGIPEPMLGPAVMPKGSDGVKGLALSPDGKFLYAAGFGPTKAPAVYRTAWGAKAGEPELFIGADRHAPRNPSSFKISKSPRARKPWGLATDSGGRIYVSDTGNNRVAVFDSEGEFLASVETPSPIGVAVHPKTGAIYVVSKLGVRKLSGWKDPRVLWTLKLPKPAGGYPPVFALDAGAPKPVLWIGSPLVMKWTKYVLWRVEDEGTSAGEPEEISDRGRQGFLSPVHLAVDPVRDEVYVREWCENQAKPHTFFRLDGATGKRDKPKLKLKGIELAVGPDGLIYIRTGDPGSWITRYDHSGSPVPFSGANDKVMGRKGFWVNGSPRGASFVGPRGFSVAPDGDIYILRYLYSRGSNAWLAKRGYPTPTTRNEYDKWHNILLDVYNRDGTLKRAKVIKYFRSGACGVKVDRQGNIYVADNIKLRGKFYPADIADQLPQPGAKEIWLSEPAGRPNLYLYNYGTLFKFPPAGGTISPAKADDPEAQMTGGACKWQYVTVKGALWRHLGISPVPAGNGRGHSVPYGCVCINGRFDLDAFGRIFVPDVHRFRVDVLDANGNKITSFGRYGNADSRGPEITFNWGSFVGVSRKAVYVCDNLNRRVVRVTLGHAAQDTCRIP